MSNHIVYAVNDTEWEAYKAKFRKYYSPNEEKQRYRDTHTHTYMYT